MSGPKGFLGEVAFATRLLLLGFQPLSEIVYEVAVWIAASPPQQVWECCFHVSVEERQIILSSFAIGTLLPERK